MSTPLTTTIIRSALPASGPYGALRNRLLDAIKAGERATEALRRELESMSAFDAVAVSAEIARARRQAA